MAGGRPAPGGEQLMLEADRDTPVTPAAAAQANPAFQAMPVSVAPAMASLAGPAIESAAQVPSDSESIGV